MANLLSTAITGTATTSGSVVIGGTFANNAYNSVSSTRLMFGGGNEPNNYSIGTNLENYGGNYTKLDLRWHTGIRIGAQPGYGGVRFFSNETLASRIMSIGETDANVRIDNNLYIGGAGGWITDLLNAKYSTSGGTISGYVRINKNWGEGDFGAEQLTIYGTYPSITLRSTTHDSKWLIHNDSSVSFYYGAGASNNSWSRRFEIPQDGNIWMSWAGDYISNLLGAKQNASTAITTSNIGSQSVNYAATAGSASVATSAGSVDGLTINNSGNPINPDNVTQNQIGYNTSVSLYGQTDGGLYSSAYSSSWIHQIYGDFRTGQIAIRGKNAGTWQDWRYVLDDKNIGSYAVPYGNMTGSTGLNDNKLYLRTNGDNNHYLWNAADDWEELVYYTGTGFRIKGSTGVVAGYFTDSEVKLNTRLTVGNFPNSTTNTGEAWVGRANDRNTGTLTVQLGGNSASSRSFEVVDYAWSTVLFSVNSNNTVSVNNYLEAGSSLRAPIFYDSNDTNYYVDPNSTSRLVQLNLGTPNTQIKSVDGVGYLRIYGSASNFLGVGPYDNNGWIYFEGSGNSNGIYFNTPGRYAFDSVDVTPYTDAENSLGNNSYRWSQVYTSGWLRQYGAQGMYNQDYGTHFYSNGGGSWGITGSGGNIELQFRSNHQSTIRGYVYADTGNQIGFLNNGGGWNFRTNSDKNAFVHGQTLTINADNAGWSSIYMNDGDEGMRELHCNSNRIGFLTQAGSWGAYLDDSTNWYAAGSMRAPIFYDSNDTSYFLAPSADWSMAVYGEICNSNYAGGKMQPGALNIGRIDTNYAWDGTSWSGDVRLGILANCSETWEFGIHDSGDSVMSALHFDGGSTLTFGRNLGWGNCYVNAQAGYISNSNPWNTNNSAFFPNGITTAGGTNWIYGFTYIGNAPGNGNGHEFNANGTQYSTTSITTPTFIVNNHSDNTRGYRIHNTSGSSVSAMFTNSSNYLVIGAGAFARINLNKDVHVNSVSLGVGSAAPSGTAGRIDASNDIVAYSSSDERLKHNITPIENAIDKVKSLTGVEFDWKPEYKHAHGYEGHDTGIIAQQVQEVIPSAVRTNDTGFLAVRYEKLIGLLVEGMKEQQAQIEELKAKLDGLTK